MLKVLPDTEITLIPLVTIRSGDRARPFRYDFQPVESNGISVNGIEYTYLDADVPQLGIRQARFNSSPQRIVIRNAPVSSQRGDTTIPGLTVQFSPTFSLTTPLDLLREFDGLRNCPIAIAYAYQTDNDSYNIERRGRSVIIESTVIGSKVILTTGNNMTPLNQYGNDLIREF